MKWAQQHRSVYNDLARNLEKGNHRELTICLHIFLGLHVNVMTSTGLHNLLRFAVEFTFGNRNGVNMFTFTVWLRQACYLAMQKIDYTLSCNKYTALTKFILVGYYIDLISFDTDESVSTRGHCESLILHLWFLSLIVKVNLKNRI